MQDENEHIYLLKDRLKLAIKNKGLMQKDLASIMEVNPVAISRYCKGKNLPGVAELLRISKILNVSTDWLLGQGEQEIIKHDNQDISSECINASPCVSRETHGESEAKTVYHVAHGDDVLVLPQVLLDRLYDRAEDLGLDFPTTLNMVVKKGLDKFDVLDQDSTYIAKELHRKVAEEQGLYDNDTNAEKNTG